MICLRKQCFFFLPISSEIRLFIPMWWNWRDLLRFIVLPASVWGKYFWRLSMSRWRERNPNISGWLRRLFPRIMQSHFVLWQRPGSIRIWFCHRKRWQRPISIWSHARWWILLKNYKIHTISHECITEYTNAHKCILHWYRTKRLNIFIFNLFSYDKCDEKYIGWWALWLNLEKESLNVGSWFWFWRSCYWFHQQSVT